jgi:transcriptional regulator with XRE-family HTH domain
MPVELQNVSGAMDEIVAAPDGAFWRDARERAGLSHNEVAKLMGKSRPWVHHIESGRRKLPVALTLDFAAVLGIKNSLPLLIASCKARRARKGV